MSDRNRWLGDALTDLDRTHLRRRRRVVRHLSSTKVEIDGVVYVQFASNDYLGLSRHPAVLSAARAASTEQFGSGAASLVTGYTEHHATAERTLADWKGVDDAVLLPSGYQANHAAVGAIASVAQAAGRGVRFLLDKLVHASIVDAVRATELPFRVFPHNGVDKLRRLLTEGDRTQLQVVVTESVFSMDGDAADLPALVALKREHPFVLLLDEAHATGLYGHDGSGYASSLGLADAVDLSVVTLSKALGGIGGAVCGSRDWCEAVVNFGRAYVFSTALPPAACAAATAAIAVCRAEPQRRQRVLTLANKIREELRAAGREVGTGDSPIVPVIVGDEVAALAAAAKLREAGFLVPAIRPPSVPRGGSRLRITLSSEHTDEDCDALIRALRY